MPYHLSDHDAKIQFVAPASFPALIHRACEETGVVSNTRYIQRAVAEALARDLDLDVDELLAHMPPLRSRGAMLFDGTRRPVRRVPPRPGR